MMSSEEMRDAIRKEAMYQLNMVRASATSGERSEEARGVLIKHFEGGVSACHNIMFATDDFDGIRTIQAERERM